MTNSTDTWLSTVPARDVGWVGTGLFCALAGGALVRLGQAVRSHGTRAPRLDGGEHRGCRICACLPCTPRKRFYWMVFWLAALDAPRYALMGVRGEILDGMDDDMPRYAYALHLLALWTQLVGLSIIAGLFANVFASNDAPRRSASPGYGTNQPNAHSSSDKWSPGGRHMGGAHESTCSETCAHAVLRATGPWPWSAVVFCVANSALLCVTGFLIHSLFELPQQMSFGKALSECGLYLPFLCSVAGVLLLTSAGLIAFGMRVRARIALHKWGPNHRARIDRVVKRLTVTLVACAACYALRVAALFSLFSENVRDNRVFSPIVWECLSYWVPTVVPSAVLLVMMRGPGKSRPGRNQEDGVTAAQSASVGHSAHYVHTASAANNVVAGQGVAVLAGVGSGAQTTLESPLMDSAQGVAMGSSPSAGGHGSELSDVSSGDDFA